MRTPGRKDRRERSQVALPGVTALQAAGKTIPVRNNKIPHYEILKALQSCTDVSKDLVGIYRQKVLSQKTRTVRLLGRKSSASIIHTLLGYEVQASYKRIHCPDFVTARYLRLFSELGCHSIRLPYDPTATAQLIPEFEAAVERVVSGIRDMFPQDPSLQHYVVRRVYAIIRAKLQAA